MYAIIDVVRDPSHHIFVKAMREGFGIGSVHFVFSRVLIAFIVYTFGLNHKYNRN